MKERGYLVLRELKRTLELVRSNAEFVMKERVFPARKVRLKKPLREAVSKEAISFPEGVYIIFIISQASQVIEIKRFARAIFQLFFIPSIFRENGIKGSIKARFWDVRGQMVAYNRS